MITDEQLTAAICRAAADLDVPVDGPTSILAATASDGPSPLREVGVGIGRTIAAHRKLAFGGALAAAAIALVVGLSLPSSPHQIDHLALPPVTLEHPVSAGNATGATGAQGIQGEAAPNAAASASAPPSTVFGENLTPTALNPSTGSSAAGPTEGVVGANGSSGAADTVPAKIASSGTLAITVTRSALNRDIADLRALAAGAGGYVSATNLTEASRSGNGSLELSVPASSFTSVVAQAQRLGVTRSLVTKADDVTQQYSGTAASIDALVDVRAQLETLLKRAGKIPDLLSVEDQIQNVQTQIDQLESEQSSLTQEITYATLTVDLHVKTAAPAKPKPPHRRSALDRAWLSAVNGFTSGLRWLLSISGGVLFAVLIGAGLLVGTRVFIRRALPKLRRFFL